MRKGKSLRETEESILGTCKLGLPHLSSYLPAFRAGQNSSVVKWNNPSGEFRIGEKGGEVILPQNSALLPKTWLYSHTHLPQSLYSSFQSLRKEAAVVH